MSQVFELCQANFYNSIRDVQRILKSPEPTQSSLQEAREAITEAAQELNKMGVQQNIHQLPQFKSKIQVFKEELRRYKRELVRKQNEFKDNQAEQHSGPLFQNEEQEGKGIDPLIEAKMQMYENEALSNQAAINLRKNNENLIKNINRLGDINNQLTVAHQLLNSIQNKLRKNKLVVWGTLAFLFLVILLVIYSYTGGSSQAEQSHHPTPAPADAEPVKVGR